MVSAGPVAKIGRLAILAAGIPRIGLHLTNRLRENTPQRGFPS